MFFNIRHIFTRWFAKAVHPRLAKEKESENKIYLADSQVKETESLQLTFINRTDSLVPAQKKRIILVAGVPRSGSTWLYNCIRLLLKLKFGDVYASWVKDYDPNIPNEIHLIKIHDTDDSFSSLTDEIYTSRRDIREIAGSLTRMGWDQKDNFFSQLDWIEKTHKYWFDRTRLEIEFSEIKREQNSLIERIGHTLGIHLNALQVESLREELSKLVPPCDLPNKTIIETYDKATQLHPNHISLDVPDYNKLLGKEMICKISNRYQDWLTRFGYIKSHTIAR